MNEAVRADLVASLLSVLFQVQLFIDSIYA